MYVLRLGIDTFVIQGQGMASLSFTRFWMQELSEEGRENGVENIPQLLLRSFKYCNLKWDISYEIEYLIFEQFFCEIVTTKSHLIFIKFYSYWEKAIKFEKNIPLVFEIT